MLLAIIRILSNEEYNQKQKYSEETITKAEDGQERDGPTHEFPIKSGQPVRYNHVKAEKGRVVHIYDVICYYLLRKELIYNRHAPWSSKREAI